MLPDLALTDNVQTDEERHHGPDHGGDADDEDSLQEPSQHQQQTLGDTWARVLYRVLSTSMTVVRLTSVVLLTM